MMLTNSKGKFYFFPLANAILRRVSFLDAHFCTPQESQIRAGTWRFIFTFRTLHRFQASVDIKTRIHTYP